MASSDLVPKQGELWLAVFGAARPGEPGKNRPALVLSADGQVGESIHDLLFVAPLSASLEPTGSRPQIAATPTTGLAEDSVIVVRATRGMSPTRLVRRLGVVDLVTLRHVQDILAALLGLP